MTHFKSNAFASTILNIFWTFIDAEVEQNMSEACIARANRFAYHTMSLFSGESPRSYLFRDFLLFVPRKCRKLIEFCAN